MKQEKNISKKSRIMLMLLVLIYFGVIALVALNSSPADFFQQVVFIGGIILLIASIIVARSEGINMFSSELQEIKNCRSWLRLTITFFSILILSNLVLLALFYICSSVEIIVEIIFDKKTLIKFEKLAIMLTVIFNSIIHVIRADMHGVLFASGASVGTTFLLKLLAN